MKYSIIIFFLLLCSLSTAEAHSLNLKSVVNARELGGYSTIDGKKIKHGILLRTAALNNISSDDINILTRHYHLSTIADLRTYYEIAQKPDPDIEGVEYINLDVIGKEEFEKQIDKKLESEGNAVERIKFIVENGIVSHDLYVNFLSKTSGKNAYSKLFRELLNLKPEHSLLFHCTQGKDRTGCAAMLILSALGADEDTIMNDYLLTNTFNADLIARQRKMLLSNGIDDPEKYMYVLDEVNPVLMNIALNWLKENYGSPLGYIINELGINEDEIEILKAKFLEE